MSAAEKRAVSLQEGARLLGRHRNTISAWIARGAPTVSAAKREAGVAWLLDLGAILTWREEEARSEEREKAKGEIESLREQLTDLAGEGAGVGIEEARRRKAVALARTAEIEVARLEGRFVDADELDRVLVPTITNIRDRLLAIPNRASGTVLGLTHEQVAALENLVREALTEVADAGEAVQQMTAQALEADRRNRGAAS